MQNHAWKLMDLPPNYKPLGHKLIFKKKMKDGWIIKKYKVELVVKKFKQQLDIN